jgi:hypothetical protein
VYLTQCPSCRLESEYICAAIVQTRLQAMMQAAGGDMTSVRCKLNDKGAPFDFKVKARRSMMPLVIRTLCPGMPEADITKCLEWLEDPEDDDVFQMTVFTSDGKCCRRRRCCAQLSLAVN